MARVNPVKIALAQPKIVAGADLRLVMINVGLLMFMLLSLRVWQWIFVALPLHWVARAITEADPDTAKVYIGYAKQADRYDPWPAPATQKRFFRPNGFGFRGLF